MINIIGCFYLCGGIILQLPHIFYLSSHEHHVDTMELSAGCLANHGLIADVMKKLLLGLLNDFCHFCICGTFLEIFQLQDITVLYRWILLRICKKEEVTITVGDLNFRVHNKELADVKIGIEIALYIALSLYAVSYATVIVVLFCQMFE